MSGARTRIQPWAAALVLGTAAAVGCTRVDPVGVRSGIIALIGIGAVLAAVTGLRWHRPADPRPWHQLVLAQVMIVTATVTRLGAEHHHLVVAHAAASLLTGAGYVLAAAAFVRMARGPGGDRLAPGAVLDCAITAIGFGTAAAVELSLPAWRIAEQRGLSGWEPLLETLHPLYDVILLVGLLMLGFHVGLRPFSYRTLIGSLAFLLAGDLVSAWLARGGALAQRPVAGALSVMSCTLITVSVLHPSTRALGRPRPRTVAITSVPEWSWRRAALFMPALIPPGLLLVDPSLSRPDRILIGVACTAAVLLLLLRASSEVRAGRQAQRHDPLTGLLTREPFLAGLGELLQARSRSGQPTSDGLWVTVIDMDGHRHAVQFWGHRTGDELVRQTGQRLREVLPPGALIARVGSDVFAAVLQGPPVRAGQDAEQLRTALAAVRDVDGMDLVSTASIGLAPACDGDPTVALRRADTAMHEARSLGGNRVCRFDPRMLAQLERRASLEQALRYATAGGELSLVYQPVVELPTGRIIGAEALLRWSNPLLGQVSPMEFIPIAEETGLIEDLGSWVLRQACRRLAEWTRAPRFPADFTMAVNVSTRQLRGDAVAQRLRDVLAETGLPPSRLVLEITESAMHDDQAAFVAVLRGLRELGVQISVDDFGTGYSSLSYLSRLPVTSVKLDRSLVADVARPPGDAIARAVEGIARALGLTVVAEGVEDETQRDAVRELGIAHGQGYLWGRPVPPQEFLALLGAQTAQTAQHEPAPRSERGEPAGPPDPARAPAPQASSTSTGA